MQQSNKSEKKQNSPSPPKTIVKLKAFAQFLEREYGITELQQFTAPEKFSYNTNSIFLGKDKEGNTRFIKTCRKADVCENEYFRSLELWQQNPTHFVRPLAYHANKPFAFVISEFCPSTPLDKYLRENKLSEEEKKIFTEDIYHIFKALQRANIVHRDICAKNFLIHNNHLVLIDCQLAVRSDNYKEISLFPNIEIVCRYNKHHALDKLLQWDDTSSLIGHLRTIGPTNDNKARYNEILNEIREAIGKLTVEYAIPPAEELRKRIKACKIKSIFNLRLSKRNKYRSLAEMYEYLLQTKYNQSLDK